MSHYKSNVRDIEFNLFEVLGCEEILGTGPYADLDRETVSAILAEVDHIAKTKLAESFSDSDGNLPVYDPKTHSVTVPEDLKKSFRALMNSGAWQLELPEELGGQPTPPSVQWAVHELNIGANPSAMLYSAGPKFAYALWATGNERDQHIAKIMIERQWGATMVLTEPDAGSDVGAGRTRAIPQSDGTWHIDGVKRFITSGEHDLTENIIHLVLAKITGAPDTVKGISLFIVPKFMVNKDGSLGARNGFQCGGLEEKMGIHGNATCVMNYDGATGYLVGEAHKGMRTMFVMMNEARLGVGMQGLAQAEVAYQNAAEFARERVQGRSITGAKAPDKPADPIIVHPDVRRMLMDCKAFVEGGRAFAYWTALQGDLLHVSPDPLVREKADDRMALLTPVIKGFLTDRGFKAASDAMQLHGGTGYTREQGVEQFVRDARIAMIYEGTNGIQALDLVGRKLAANAGRAVFGFFSDLEEFVSANENNEKLKPFVTGVQTASGQLREGTMWLMQNGMSNFDNAGASSHDYLQLFGLTALSLMWARMAKAALEKAGTGDRFYTDKLVTARYFFDRVLPDATSHLAKVKTGAGPVMALSADGF